MKFKAWAQLRGMQGRKEVEFEYDLEDMLWLYNVETVEELQELLFN